MTLIEIDAEWLVIRVLIISVSTIGIVQWLKNYVSPKHKRGYALVSLVVTSISTAMQAPMVPPALTIMYNLLTCALAVNQIAYDYIIRGIQSLVERTMSGGVVKGVVNNDTE